MKEIEDFLNIDWITVWRTKNRYLKYGVEKALEEDNSSGQPIKYTTDHQAELSPSSCGKEALHHPVINSGTE